MVQVTYVCVNTLNRDAASTARERVRHQLSRSHDGHVKTSRHVKLRHRAPCPDWRAFHNPQGRLRPRREGGIIRLAYRNGMTRSPKRTIVLYATRNDNADSLHARLLPRPAVYYEEGPFDAPSSDDEDESERNGLGSLNRAEHGNLSESEGELYVGGRKVCAKCSTR
jgi:hypothetical protein